MLFKDQIEKRFEQEQLALQEAVSELADDLGLHAQTRTGRSTDNQALKQLFQALNIKDYLLEADDFITAEEQMERILRPRGIMKRQIALTGKWWAHTVGPLLGKDKQGDLVALIPLRWSRNYTYLNKIGKRVLVNRKRMREELSQEAYCFYPPLPLRALKAKDLFLFIASVIQLPEIMLLLCSCLVVSLFGLFFPFLNKQIFDHVIPNGVLRDLYPIGGLLIGVGVGSVLFGVTRDLVLARFKDLINVHLQNAVMSRTFSLHPSFFWKYSSGELSNRITAVNQLSDQMNDLVLSSLLTLLFSFVYLWQILQYAGALLAPALGVISIQIILLFLYFYLKEKNLKQYLPLESKLNGLIFNLFNGIQKIKLTGSEKRAFTRWLDNYRSCVAFEYNPSLFLKLMPSFLLFCSMGGTTVYYYYSIETGISSSDYIAFSVAYGMIGGVISRLAGIVPNMAQLGPLLEMSKPILEALPEIAVNAPQVSFLSGSIELSNLSFRYSPDSPWILRNLNVKIKPGEYVAIVGKSGCGKSTLLRLLLGFEQPQSGGIYYDSYDLSKVDKTSLRQCVGCCLQSGSLFPGSVFSNITITAPESTFDDAWEAARLAGIDQDIRELPMGMHTLISEGGGGFSGGQKQRLLIARALMNKPSILLFDEATSALDNISQKQVSDNLNAMGCTRLVIAHRFSTIRHCNRILVLDNGTIIEEGTFDELMKNGKLFYEMSKRQL